MFALFVSLFLSVTGIPESESTRHCPGYTGSYYNLCGHQDSMPVSYRDIPDSYWLSPQECPLEWWTFSCVCKRGPWVYIENGPFNWDLTYCGAVWSFYADFMEEIIHLESPDFLWRHNPNSSDIWAVQDYCEKPAVNERYKHTEYWAVASGVHYGDGGLPKCFLMNADWWPNPGPSRVCSEKQLCQLIPINDKSDECYDIAEHSGCGCYACEGGSAPWHFEWVVKCLPTDEWWDGEYTHYYACAAYCSSAATGMCVDPEP